MTTLTLYSTSGCHLCEKAMILLKKQNLSDLVNLKVVDISEDDALVEAYGIRIPVLKHDATGQELGWPFDDVRLAEWLTQIQA